MLRWHRRGFRLFQRRKSRPHSAPRSKVAAGAIALIREMAAATRPWGAECIPDELLRRGVGVAKAKVAWHMLGGRPPQRAGRAWATFLRNHAADVWAHDFRLVDAFSICRRRHVGTTTPPRPAGPFAGPDRRGAMPHCPDTG